MFEGYYGLIQYMPRPETLEGVNVGVYLLCAEPHFVEVILSPNHNPIRRHFPGLVFNSMRLHADMRAVANRIRACSSCAELRELGARGYGQLFITQPLPTTVMHPVADLAVLYKDLVEELIYNRQRIQAPNLQQAIRDLSDVPIELNVKIPIPVLERNWVAPIAYLNKARNYVKPHGFPDDERRAIDAASSIGVVGHLLARNSTRVGGEEVGQRLIVVANLSEGNVLNRVTDVLRQFETEVMPASQIQTLVQHIRDNARRPQRLYH